MDCFKRLVVSGILAMGVCTTGCDRCAHSDRGLLDLVLHYQWLGDPEDIPFAEPSGICWHGARQTLFIVGDEGAIGNLGFVMFDGSQAVVRHLDDIGVAHIQKHLRDGRFAIGVGHDDSLVLNLLGGNAFRDADSQVGRVDSRRRQLRLGGRDAQQDRQQKRQEERWSKRRSERWSKRQARRVRGE